MTNATTQIVPEGNHSRQEIKIGCTKKNTTKDASSRLATREKESGKKNLRTCYYIYSKHQRFSDIPLITNRSQARDNQFAENT